MYAPFVAGSSRARAEATVAAVNQTLPLLAELATMGRQTKAFVSVQDPCADTVCADAAVRLRALFRQYGSDKSTNHNYEYLYAHLLKDATSIKAVLEIGLGTTNPNVLSHMGANARPGGSLRAFREFLPNAMILGADIDKDVLFEEHRIRTFCVDQTDRMSLERLGEEVGYELDLVIDDGLHAPHANLNTLQFALPRLRPGGAIVIEDIWVRALAIWQVAAEIIPNDYESSILEAEGAFVFLVRRKDS